MPTSICPSAPMLRMPLRKEMATPRATRVSGTARTRISEAPKRSASGPVKMVTKVAQGLRPDGEEHQGGDRHGGEAGRRGHPHHVERRGSGYLTRPPRP